MLEVMDQAARHLVNSRTGPSWFSESLRGHADRPISGFSHSTGTFAELRDHSAFDLPGRRTAHHVLVLRHDGHRPEPGAGLPMAARVARGGRGRGGPDGYQGARLRAEATGLAHASATRPEWACGTVSGVQVPA
ncbi:hypothetical protein [Nonomuraea angiospora]